MIHILLGFYQFAVNNVIEGSDRSILIKEENKILDKKVK